ncbi:MAG: hypothetical protein ABI656_01570 [bacterium]
MKPQQWKRWGWWVFVGVFAGLTAAIAFNNDDAITPVPPVPSAGKHVIAQVSRKQHAPDLVRVELDRLSRQAPGHQEEGEFSNVFNVTSWHVEPPPPPPPPHIPDKPAPPPKPTAPPMPFTYLGRYADAEVQVVMLAKGDQLYTVSVGDMIENVYRVERVAPGIVELTYLPLNIRQSIATGDA